MVINCIYGTVKIRKHMKNLVYNVGFYKNVFCHAFQYGLGMMQRSETYIMDIQVGCL